MYTIWLVALLACSGGEGAGAYTVVHSTGYGPAAVAALRPHAAHDGHGASAQAVSYRSTTWPYEGSHRATTRPYDVGHRVPPGTYDGGQRVPSGPYDESQRVSPGPYDNGHRAIAGPYDGNHIISPGPYEDGHRVPTDSYDAGYSGGGTALDSRARPLGQGWLLVPAPVPPAAATTVRSIEEELAHAVAGSADDILYARPASSGYRYRRRPTRARAPPRPAPPPRRPTPLIIRVHRHRIIRD